ncbi:MAG: HEAT repeat domain-containing protein [bacterium]
MDEKQLNGLLARMNHSDSTFKDKPESVSWIAHREAEQLNDAALIPMLAESIARSKSKVARRSVYFAAGKIGKNTGSEKACAMLLEALERETDKYSVGAVLDRLAEQAAVPFSPKLVECARDARWIVRYSAIDALGKCRHPEAEAALIEIIGASEDPNDLLRACASIGRAGSPESVPCLTAALENPKTEVKCAVLLALQQIGDASLTPVFLGALEDKANDVKWYAMGAIASVGDGRAVAPVIERVKKIVSSQRKANQSPKSELVFALEYLIRHIGADKTIPDFLRQIRAKHWGRLFEPEKEWFERIAADSQRKDA